MLLEWEPDGRPATAVSHPPGSAALIYTLDVKALTTNLEWVCMQLFVHLHASFAGFYFKTDDNLCMHCLRVVLSSSSNNSS